jgi:hypothetical protein
VVHIHIYSITITYRQNKTWVVIEKEYGWRTARRNIMSIFKSAPAPVSFMSKVLSFCGSVIIIAGAIVLAITALNYCFQAAAAATSLVVAGGAAVMAMFSVDKTEIEGQIKSEKFAKAG